ncbi:flagellin [Porticoccaceae bacterium]|nr:flagellin [Porticoccaceae bacterium]
MTVINTNTAATITANALTKNERAMSQAMERLSTGVRINSAGDDAAGLAISSRMTSQINGLDMAVRNANDAISMVQTEDGAMVEVTNMLQRMRELSVQASSGTMGSTDRTALDTEFSALASQIQAIGSNTQWNGTDIIDGTPGTSGAVAFQVGANASQTVSHTFAKVDTSVVDGSNDVTVTATTAAADPSTKQKTTFDFNDSAVFAVGDTLTFVIAGENHSAEVLSLDGDDILSIKFHGSSTTITEGSGTHVVTSTSAAGNITASMTADNEIIFEGATGGASATFTAAKAAAFSDGTTATGGTASRGLVAGIMYADISSVNGANSALKTVDHAIEKINTARSSSGAVINRLEYAADNLANVSQNTSASRSRILDADYASETTELARTQIIQQAGTAMLSQANQQAQSVLALLK